MEIEAKLLVPDPVTADRIRSAQAWGSGYELLPGVTIAVVDTYLDTDSMALHAAGYACRRRTVEGVIVMTLKALGGASQAIHRREELEQTLALDSQPSQWPAGPVREKVLSLIGDQKLQALFDLRQDRFVRDVVFSSRRIASASLDFVTVEGDAGKKEWHELEIELLPDGNEQDLSVITEWVRSAYGLRPSLSSKFDAALAAARKKPAPRRAPAVRRAARTQTVELTAPATPTEESFLSVLSTMGYRAQPRARRTERLLFYDTSDGVAAKKGLTLRFSPTDREWRLCSGELTKAVAPVTGEEAPDVAEISRLLPQGASPGPWIVFLHVELRENAYRLKGPSGQPLTLRIRMWDLESAQEPIVKDFMMDLSVSGAAPSTDLGYLTSLLTTRLACMPIAATVLTRGLAVLGLPAPGAPMPDEFRLRPGDTVFHARHRILAGEAWRIGECLTGVAKDLDPEYVHQMRVATRRARFALRLFDGTEAEEARALTLELGWLADLLGDVRDKDVLMVRCRGMYEGIRADGEFQTSFELRLSSGRSRSLAVLQEALVSERMRGLLQRLKAPSGDPVSSKDPSSLSAFGVRCVARVFDKVSRWGRRPAAEFSDAELHRLRILFKRARYTCDFFGPVLGKEVAALARAIVPYQDCLGSFQDARAALAILDRYAVEWAAERPPGSVLIALGGLMQMQRQTHITERELFEQLWVSVGALVARWHVTRRSLGDKA